MTKLLRICAIAFAALSAMPLYLHAQLRPLDAVELEAFRGYALRADIGIGLYQDQRASLAGTQGRLLELGNARLLVRTGRIVLEFAGTVRRQFDDEEVYAAPVFDARSPDADRARSDAGDYRAATIVRLTSPQSTWLAALRFGARLPTTDNRVGLDRDATDFFATVAAQRGFGRLSFTVESGVGINGTRKSTYEQSDVLLYAVTGAWRLPRVTLTANALGQEDLHDWIAVRGNEDLGELRVGLRTQGKQWLTAAWVHGYHDYSPSNGFQIGVGASFK